MSDHQREELGKRYRLRIPDAVPERFIITRMKLVEEASQDAGGDVWEITGWLPPMPGLTSTSREIS